MGEKQINGENWGVCGKMNTGKTHITRELAAQIQARTNKPILVFDHANNPSYEDIVRVIDTDYLVKRKLKPGETYRISGEKDIDYFIMTATDYVRDTIVVLDDCGNYFTGNTTQIQMAFIMASKNNRNDVFYQFHNFNDISPKLCRAFQMLVIKEQAIGTIPDKVPNAPLVQILHDEVQAENDELDPMKIWSYRIYDIGMDYVYWEDPETKKLTGSPGREYFRE